MRIDRVTVGALDANCWVVSDDLGGPAVVIDPGDEAARITAAIGDRRLTAVILTHGHFDHLGAVAALTAIDGVVLYVHQEDAERITSAVGSGGAIFGFDQHFSPPADHLVKDGDVLSFGRLEITVIHTPGHTSGGVCLLATDAENGAGHLFSGDTLFAGSVGRSDLPGGDGRMLARSIAQKLAPLSPDIVVHPGHGPDTTIGREARINPFWPRG